MLSECGFSSALCSTTCICLSEPLRLERAQTVKARLTGLLGRQSMTENEAVWLEPCRAVHTVGMQFDLAIYFVDRFRNVIDSYPRVAPGQVRICWRAFSVVETIAIASGHCPDVHRERVRQALREAPDAIGMR